MFDKEPVQQRGFKNVYRNGQAIGFQILYRSTYYRGIWLSLSTGFSVMVDGEQFPRDAITVTIDGKTFTQDEAAQAGKVHWDLETPAILTITKPGGLAMGVHEVTVNWDHRISYGPPNPKARKRTGPAKPHAVSMGGGGEFGGGNCTRDLVMV
ncbi:MAG: hypothetical protein IT169_06015 [Bryobacterales bacterium]|nr:hypothetical protein [Bryobacterales bacterium]